MPKRYNNIYEKIITIDNIKHAHKCAKKDKSHYDAVKKTEEHLDERCLEIQKMLKEHTYKVSPYSVSVIKDKNKKRILYKLPYYPDRIIQWAIMNQIEPIFREVFTNFTCASIPNRGIHQASDLINKWINVYPEETKYCLKMDVKKFYPSINRNILKKLLRKKFKDKDLLIELDKIIDSMDNCDISNLSISEEEKQWYSREGKGIPVGSYLSQYLANYYLSYFDHWLKETLHCKFVARYMDDLYILAPSKEKLWYVFNEIDNYLKVELDLTLKGNYQIFPVDKRGIDFVGYRHFRGYKLLRKSTLKTFKQNAKIVKWCCENKEIPTERQWSAWVSSIGWLQWCDSINFYNKYYKNYIPTINTFYNLNKKGKYKRAAYQFMIPYKSIKINKKYWRNKNDIYKQCVRNTG